MRYSLTMITKHMYSDYKLLEEDIKKMSFPEEIDLKKLIKDGHSTVVEENDRQDDLSFTTIQISKI